MQRLELKATHKPVQNYYAALRQFDNLGVTHETAVRSAFQGLLDHCARQHDWTLVPEWESCICISTASGMKSVTSSTSSFPLAKPETPQ